jgi:hypothetical protein
VADLLLNYIPENSLTKRPNTLNFDESALFVNRSKTVPAIKYRNRQEERHQQKEEENCPENKTLSPVSLSQNLLEAAINSLSHQQFNGPQSYQAVSATIKAPQRQKRQPFDYQGNYEGNSKSA